MTNTAEVDEPENPAGMSLTSTDSEEAISSAWQNSDEAESVEQLAPHVIPPQHERETLRLRSTFSSDARKLRHHTVAYDTHDVRHISQYSSLHNRSRSSSQLLDDLIRHPLDPLFEDSTLTRHTISPLRKIITRIVSFILCVCVGILGTQAVQNLHGESREKVRKALASQLVDVTSQEKKLEKDIANQRAQISTLTKQAVASSSSHNDTMAIANAQVAVKGPGISVILTNPQRKEDTSAASDNRVTAGQNTSNITDAHLQYLVSLLWQSGAEAISINNQRLGPQTSIRAAGTTILIGVIGIESPYVLSVIGDRNALRASVEGGSAHRWRSSLNAIGAGITVDNKDQIDLPAASTVDTSHAKLDR